MYNLHVCGYWHSRWRKQLAWLYKQNYILPLIYCTQGITQYSLHATADEVNNKILSVKSDFDDIASCGYSSVLWFISYVDVKLRGHWGSDLRGAWCRLSRPPFGCRYDADHGEMTAGWTHRWLWVKRRKMAAPHVAKHRGFCQAQQTSHSWVRWAEKFPEM